MRPFTEHTGIVTPMDQVNVDTDQIIPKQFLKRIERTGFGQFLFYDWRFLENGDPNPDFGLNLAGYEGASILVTGRNFGSGSSREHAPWALLDYGFRCILAPSFADIFQKNCLANGLVPVLLTQDQTSSLIARATETPGYRLTVNLDKCTVSDTNGLNLSFKVHNDPTVHALNRHCLLNGLDDIGLTLKHEDKISTFEAGRGRFGGVLGNRIRSGG